MKRELLGLLTTLSLCLNTSCYFMAASSDSRVVIDTQVTQQNKQILSYKPIVRLKDFDLSQHQLSLHVMRYPVVKFDEHRRYVKGKANLGKTVLNGTLGYGSLAGLMVVGSAVPSIATSSTTQQGLLYGAAATGGIAAIDLLLSMIQYIPSVEESNRTIEEARPQEVESVKNTFLTVYAQQNGEVLYSGTTDASGHFTLPITTLLQADSTASPFRNTFYLAGTDNAFPTYSLELSELRKGSAFNETAAEQLKHFEDEQTKYLNLLHTSPSHDLNSTLAAARKINTTYLLPEQIPPLKKHQREWYRQQYKELVQLANSSTHNSNTLAQALEKAKQIRPDSPHYQALQTDIANWVQKSYQQTFQQAAQQAAQKYFKEAIQLAATIPNSAQVYNQVQKKIGEWRNLNAQKLYQWAHDLASQKNYRQALELLQEIPKTAPIYTQAQKKRPEWQTLHYHEIYLQAFRYAEKGDFEAAIQEISQLPSGAKDYKQGQTKLVQWKKLLENKQQLARKAQEEQEAQARREQQIRNAEAQQRWEETYQIGNSLCINGDTLLGLINVTVKGYIEDRAKDRVKLRIYQIRGNGGKCVVYDNRRICEDSIIWTYPGNWYACQ